MNKVDFVESPDAAECTQQMLSKFNLIRIKHPVTARTGRNLTSRMDKSTLSRLETTSMFSIFK